MILLYEGFLQALVKSHIVESYYAIPYYNTLKFPVEMMWF
jgi:hypothetical protein